jgi:rhodanese-related sulfurtransferase
LPNTVSITFPGMGNAGLMAMLDYHGIAVSAGSACSSHDDKPSRVLEVIGLSDQAAQETIRISLGCSTTGRDIRYATRVFREYAQGRALPIALITPAQLNESVLFDEQTYLLDVRSQVQRKRLPGLPNSHEASFVSIDNYLHQLPRHKHIVVVCQRGRLSHIVAHYLKSKGFERVSNLVGGISDWKALRSDLYDKHAGESIAVLQPAR